MIDPFDIVSAGDLAGLWSGAVLLFVLIDWARRRPSRPVSPLIPDDSKSDVDVRRRRDSKRWNERIKLLATFANNLSIATLATAIIIPYATSADHVVRNDQIVTALIVAVGGLIGGQMILGFWKSEE